MRRLLEQGDPRALITGWARILVEIDARVAPPVSGARSAPPDMDAAAQALVEESQRQRLAGARMVVERLAALDALNPDLARGEAIDVAWLATDPRCSTAWSG